MKEEEPYNPFSKPHSGITQPAEIYDEGSLNKPKNDRLMVQFDVIDDFKPFSGDTIAPKGDYNSQNTATVDFTNLDALQNDLEARSQRLSEEEERLKNRENAITAIANFPPFPKCCRLKPCFYQDIDVEIPIQYRPIVKYAYGLWICYCVSLLLNVIGSLAALIAFSNVPGFSSNIPTLFGVSILLLILFVPLSYLFWFRRLYIAFKTDSSLQFFLFFIMFSLYLVSLVVEVIGIPQCGVCGWMLVVMTKEKTGIMCFMIVIALSFTLLTVASFYLLLRVNLYFRSSGGTFTQAKQELTTNSVQSSTFRSVFLGASISKK